MHRASSAYRSWSVVLSLCVIAGCAPHDAPEARPRAGSQPQLTAAAITSISMERRCFGCDREMRLVFSRDGTATRTAFGNARRGTKDEQFIGAIAASDFEQLAKLLSAEGFFELLDEYKDPQVVDGEWATIAVTTATGKKAVLASNNAGPSSLRRIAAAIEALGNTVTWRDLR